jgi:hypothetical protein
MAEKDLVARIKEEIQNAGQPLELKTYLTLQRNSWDAEPSVYYNDNESRVKREIDIVARKTKDNGQTEYENTLIIECKKSAQKPWVFFKQDSITPSVLDMNIIKYGNCNIGLGFFDKGFSKGMHPFCNYPMHTCSLVAFSKGGESNQIFHAVEQVLSALTFFTDRAKRQIDQSDRNWSPRVVVVYPIIVFDGQLVSASIVDDQMVIDEVSVIQYRINQEFSTNKPLMIEKDSSGPSPNYKSYIIPIVREDHFEKYIQTLFNNG